MCVYLPSVTSGFVPGIFGLHGGVYLTDRKFFVWAAQDSTPEDNREGVGWSAISVPQTVQARWAVGVLLVLCGSMSPLSYLRSARNVDVKLTGYFRFSIVVRTDGRGLVVNLTPREDNQYGQLGYKVEQR